MSKKPDESFEAIARAIQNRLLEFDVHTSTLPPPVAGSMRRSLRKNLKRLAEIKTQLEVIENVENQTIPH
jgi:hypothetical protein